MNASIGKGERICNLGKYTDLRANAQFIIACVKIAVQCFFNYQNLKFFLLLYETVMWEIF